MAVERYGARWSSPIVAEIEAIRRGGEWEAQNSEGVWVDQGLGLFEHYKRLQSLLWPWKGWDRWSEQILRNIIQNRFTGLVGPNSSTKTHSAADYIVSTYACYPTGFCGLVSSTDSRSLELRVWGEIKKLWSEAKLRYPDMPGRIVESKQMIVTDIEDVEATDFRNGLLGVPCMVGGNYQGLSRYSGIKQGRIFLAADECFPAGTPVLTLGGYKPIETIRKHELVMSASGWNPVESVFFKYATALVKISLSNGKTITCTQNHPFFTQSGWVKAIDLSQVHYILSADETMQILRETNSRQNQQSPRAIFLQSLLQREMDALPAIHNGESECTNFQDAQTAARRASLVEGKAYGRSKSDEPCSKRSRNRQATSDVESDGIQTVSSGWEWNRSDSSGKNSTGAIPGIYQQLPGENWTKTRERISSTLQSGCGFSRNPISNRSRWRISQSNREAIPGPEKDRIFEPGAWVDGVEVQEQENFGGNGSSLRGIEVFNLSVKGHPSYVVNGFVVHNCQFMPSAYFDAIMTLQKNHEFKAVALGNPKDRTDTFGKLCEPSLASGGWEAYEPTGKTMEWNTHFPGGKVIQLDGRDSPNNDFPKVNGEFKYWYLINQDQIDNDIKFHGGEDWHVYMNDYGIFPRDAQARRVISRLSCDRFRAFEEPSWRSDNLIKQFTLDAAYGAVGGDRCVGIETCWGPCTDGKIRLACVGQPMVIPVKASLDVAPEDQIAQWVMDYCVPKGIEPGHVAFDSTGRGSLVSAFGRLWSTEVVAIEFGGAASERPAPVKVKGKDGQQIKAKDYYYNFVTELWFAWPTLVESDQCRALSTVIVDEGTLRGWDYRNRKIQVEVKTADAGKPCYKARLGRSPDYADSWVVAIELARRLGFGLGDAGSKDEEMPLWLEEEAVRAKARMKRQQLVYH